MDAISSSTSYAATTTPNHSASYPPSSTTQADTKTASSSVDGTQLSEEDQARVEQLKKSDRNVRQHEQAHMAAAGGMAQGGASYSFVAGPDGQRYAVAGEVQIDTSPGRTPEETLRKARAIQAAALAPADPSGQDRAVATQAKSLELQAQAAIAKRSPTEQKLAGSYQSGEVPASSFATRA